jgi:hypothetical protein
MFKEKQLIQCTDEEIVRFQKFEFEINEQIDNLVILISTGALIFSSNLILHLEYNSGMFKYSWIILILSILFSLWNRIATSEKTSYYLGKFYKAIREGKSIIEVSRLFTKLEIFFYRGALGLVTIGIVLLSLAFITKL